MAHLKIISPGPASQIQSINSCNSANFEASQPLKNQKPPANPYNKSMFTEKSLMNATCQYHKFDTSQHMMGNRAFALTALNNLKQDK